MRTRVSYPQEVKLKAVEMKLQGIPTKVILEELNIRNDTQIETWTRWYEASDHFDDFLVTCSFFHHISAHIAP